MTRLKIDPMLPVHPKVLHLSHEAFRLYITSGCWSGLNATKGHIPGDIAYFLAEIAQISEQPVLAEPFITELVASGCWTAIEGDGYQIAANPNGGAEFWDIVASLESDE